MGTTVHDPFKRAMSYQAFRVFKTWGKELRLTHGNYARQLAMDVEAEVEAKDDVAEDDYTGACVLVSKEPQVFKVSLALHVSVNLMMHTINLHLKISVYT